jgi:hypothetical protein
MHEGTPLVLKAWADFYVIAGSSAAALTGLMFVVITLVAGDRARTASDGISTFSTPTVVHFCAALLVSLVLSAPWRSLAHLGTLLALVGIWGVGYAVLLMYRMGYRLRHEVYAPGLDDWLWYAVLPFVAYAAIFAAALWLRAGAAEALVAIAAAVALLIFIGIHNAWDVVTYLAIGKVQEPDAATTTEAVPATTAAPATAAVASNAAQGGGPPPVA